MMALIYTCVVLCFLLSAFFSGIETGFISLDKIKLGKDARQDRLKRRMLAFLDNPERLMATTLVGNNVVNVTLTTLIIAFVVPEWRSKGIIDLWGEEFAPIITALSVLIFGEIIPKALYRDHSLVLVSNTFPLLNLFYKVMSPAARAVGWLNHIMTGWFGLSSDESVKVLTREDISFILTENNDVEQLDEPQREMIREALEFNSLQAKNVLVPRMEIEAVPCDMPLEQVLDFARQKGYTRYPVYEGRLDNIKGILIIYDVLKYGDLAGKTAGDIVRKAYFAPENMDLSALLAALQHNQMSMAVVVDPHGGTAGIISVEDILEQIVGDIEDEYDTPDDFPTDVRRVGNSWQVSGQVEIDRLEDEFEVELPQGDYETVAGLVINRMGRLPQNGQSLLVEGWRIDILHVTQNKIQTVLLTALPTPTEE